MIYASGMIASGQSSYDAPSGQVVGSDTIIDYLRKARADSSIKAIVLRVDSPGGSAIASDVIWREVMLTREREAGDRLDVGRRRVGRLLHRHAGARDRRAARHAHRIDRRRDAQVRDRRHAEEARDEHGGRHAGALRRSLFAGAAVLAGRARQGPGADAGDLRHVRREGGRRARTPRRERIDAIAQGRVWTGKQAKQLGLVDELGGLERALASPSNAPRSRRTAKWSWSSSRRSKSIYEIVENPFGGRDSAAVARAMLGFRDPRRARAADGAAPRFPPRRAAGDHAERVRPLVPAGSR